MADASFDVVSKVDQQEVDNALNQAAKEVGQRFDFKGTGASISWSGDDGVVITANSDERVQGRARRVQGAAGQAAGLVQGAGPRRSRSRPAATPRGCAIAIRQGIDSEKARAIVKKIKADGPKGVQVAVQGDTVRVSSKKRDDLQTVIAMLQGIRHGHPAAVRELPLTAGPVAVARASRRRRNIT